jgi:hypothetical protein
MDLIKEKFHIVCARYNEDIRWLLPYKHITIIYNKGSYNEILNKFESITLNNVGRESHTYLYHIITNYDNLSNKTIFFQGKINDHKILDIEEYFGENDFIGKIDKLYINKLSSKIDHYGKYLKDLNTNNMKLSNYTPLEFITNIIGIDINNIKESKVVWGANFSVSKKLIHSKPKIFYENILRYIENHINPEEGHFIERCWYLIYHSNYVPKKKINYIYIKEYNNIIDNLLTNLNKLDYDEFHIWIPINANFEIGKYKNIHYTPNNFKYITINPNIINDKFELNINGNNDAHILIEFDKYEEKYEIVLGGWNNSQSVIRNYINGKIISNYENKILDKNKYINFTIFLPTILNNKLQIMMDNSIILETKHIFDNNIIKNIKIKSCFNSSIYWNYNDILNDKIKYLLYINKYENIQDFYIENFTDYYVNEINILDLI